MGADDFQAAAAQKAPVIPTDRERVHAAMRAASAKGCGNLPGCAFRPDHVETIICDELVALVAKVRAEGMRAGRAEENEACEKAARDYHERKDHTLKRWEERGEKGAPVDALIGTVGAATDIANLIAARWRP